MTWSRITLCRPSATSLSISTPRLIGPGCMIRQSGFKNFARSFVRPNRRDVFAKSREIFFALPLVLDPQQIHDIGLGEDVVDVVRNGDAHLFKLAWHERAWADERDARAEL